MQIKTNIISSSQIFTLSSSAYELLPAAGGGGNYYETSKIICTLNNITIPYNSLGDIEFFNEKGPITYLYSNLLNSSNNTSYTIPISDTFTGSLSIRIPGTGPTTGNGTLQIDTYVDRGNISNTNPIFTFSGSVAVSGSLLATASWVLNAGTIATQSFTTQSLWQFNHNLGRREVVIQAYNEEYKQIIPQDIELFDINKAFITFNDSASGFAVASFGGVSPLISVPTSSTSISVYSGKFDALTSQPSATENFLSITDVQSDPTAVISNSGGTITVTDSGYYQINSQLGIDYTTEITTADDGHIVVNVNSTGSYSTIFGANNVRFISVPLNCLLYLSSSDSLEFYFLSRNNSYNTKATNTNGVPSSPISITKLR